MSLTDKSLDQQCYPRNNAFNVEKIASGAGRPFDFPSRRRDGLKRPLLPNPQLRLGIEHHHAARLEGDINFVALTGPVITTFFANDAFA